MPLKEIRSINERHDIVGYFLQHSAIREEIEEQIRGIGDIERLISKAAVGRINPREVWHIKNALYALDPIIKICESSSQEPLKNIAQQLDPCIDIREKINLAAFYPEVVKELDGLIEKHLEEVGCFRPIKNEAFDPEASNEKIGLPIVNKRYFIVGGEAETAAPPHDMSS